MPNLGDLNLNQAVPQAEMWLAKPDRTLLGKLTQRASIGFSRFGKRTKMLKHVMLYKLNNVSELDFSIPFEIEINHELVKNPIIDLIRERYLIKVLYSGTEEWFVICDITNAMDGDKNLKIIKARSLAYEMINRGVRQLDLAPVNLSTLLNGGSVMDSKGNSFFYGGLLGSTLWKLDPAYDVTFDTMYRSFNITKATVLDVILQASKVYNAICIFDTINRKINFKQLVNIGQDKGFKISYKNYMKSVENNSKSDELATIFIPTGKNNLGISGVTANGQNSLSDYSFFMYPFSRDASKVVIQHSNYMSDSLCHALLDYQVLLNTNSTKFSTLLANLTTYQTQLTTKQNEMATLTTGLRAIQSNLDIAQSTGQPTATLLSQQTSQNALIATKQSEINAVNANITSTQSSISTLNTTLSSANNFTPTQLSELSYYAFEKTWESPNITDAQSLYNQALIEFPKWSTPQTIVKVDIINLLEMQTEQRNWDKLTPISMGDTIGIEYDTIGTNIKAKLVEFSIDHINSNITLTIANVDDLKRDEEKVYAMLYRGVGASNSLSVNSTRWDGIDSASANINALYNNGINSALINVNGGNGSTTKIDGRGFTSASSTVNTDFIRINNGVAIFSSDGGQTANIAIDKTGIYANKLVGQIIAGTNLTVTNSSGSFTMNGSGVTIAGASLTITSGLPDTQISSASTWNTASSNASTAITNAAAANALLSDIANDNKLTPSEKQDTKKEWDIIVSEKSTIDAQATTYGITTEKTTYGDAYTALNTYITPLLSNLTTTDTIVGTTFRSTFKTYYDARTALLKKVSDLAKSLADSAQALANTSVQLGTSYNNVIINASSGINVIDSLVTSKTTMDSLGFKIQTNIGTSGSPIWSDSLVASSSGLSVSGIIRANELYVNGTKITDGVAGRLTGVNIVNGSLSVTHSNGSLTIIDGSDIRMLPSSSDTNSYIGLDSTGLYRRAGGVNTPLKSAASNGTGSVGAGSSFSTTGTVPDPSGSTSISLTGGQWTGKTATNTVVILSQMGVVNASSSANSYKKEKLTWSVFTVSGGIQINVQGGCIWHSDPSLTSKTYQETALNFSYLAIG